MNIVIISPFENSLTKRGNRLPFLSELLVKSGFNVKYVSSNFYHAEKRSFSSKEVLVAKKNQKYDQMFFSVPGYQSNFSISRMITHQIFSIKVFLYLISQPSPNLVIIPSRPPELIFLVNLTKFLKKFKLIIDISDTWPEGFPKRDFFYLLFSIYCNLFQYFSIPSNKNFIFTSPMFLEWIFKYQKNCEPRFITLGYDKERWSENKPLEKIGKEKKIFYIGNIAQTINLYPLINGIKGFKDWSLTIIGGGDRLEETKNFVRDNNIKNVFFKGFVKKNVLPSLIKEYNISVIPFDKAGMPNKLFDSIAAYKPILAFGENDTTKFITENDIGWVLGFNVNEVIKFLSDLEDSDIIKKSKNILKIREQYSKDYIYNQFFEYIKEVLS